MKKQTLYFVFLSLFIMMAELLTSCSKEVLSDSDKSVETGSTLVVKTRAADGDGADRKVSYPVTVYVFDVSGKCVDVSVIADADDRPSIKLASGMYSVCAVAGATTDDYLLPAQADATAQWAVTLKEGRKHADLMFAGSNSVIIQSGETHGLELIMARKVMLLQEVRINSVPENVTDVSVTVLPLYEGVCIDGAYSGGNGAQKVTLTKEQGTDIWKNTDGIYMLAASGDATVTVSMTDEEGTKSYSYSIGGGLEANYKIKIEGTYIANEGVLLAGTMTGVEWAGERVISFNFNDNGSSGSGGNQGGTSGSEMGTIEGEAPAVGTIYNGCYVYSVDKHDDGSATVVLMSGKTESGLSFDSNDQTSVAEAVNEKLAMFEIEGVDVWRLPTWEELKGSLDNYKAINKVLEANELTTITTGLSFFYSLSDGRISSYCYSGKTDFNTKTRLRAFATVVFR